jgi:hypothetical protein
MLFATPVARVTGTQQAVRQAAATTNSPIRRCSRASSSRQGHGLGLDRPQDRLDPLLDQDQHVEGRRRRRSCRGGRHRRADRRHATAFIEANLKAVLQSIWNSGGKPDTIMLAASTSR